MTLLFFYSTLAQSTIHGYNSFFCLCCLSLCCEIRGCDRFHYFRAKIHWHCVGGVILVSWLQINLFSSCAPSLSSPSTSWHLCFVSFLEEAMKLFRYQVKSDISDFSCRCLYVDVSENDQCRVLILLWCELHSVVWTVVPFRWTTQRWGVGRWLFFVCFVVILCSVFNIETLQGRSWRF